MANIDTLNFEVLIDDKQFNKKIIDLETRAKKLNIEMTQLLNMSGAKGGRMFNAVDVNNAKKIEATLKQIIADINKVPGAVNRATAATEKTTATVDKTTAATKNATAAANSHAAAVGRINTQYTKQSTLLRQLGSAMGMYFSVYAVRRFLSSLVDITGEFEVQQKALRVILNDAGNADKIFENLRQFAIESPYTFKELASYTKQLAAFSIPTENLLQTNKMLADVAAGLGVSMDRLILAYGHVKSSGFLRGMQLRQFTQNGVPILEYLAEILTEVEGKAISLGEVFSKMMKREIPFEYVEEAFKRMTSEGGKFYRMQETLVNTLKGQMGKLRDIWEQSMYDLGQSNRGPILGVIKAAQWFAQNLTNIMKVVGPLVAAFGGYVAVLALVTLAQKAVAIGAFAVEFVVMAKNVGIAMAALTAFGGGATSILPIIGALAAGIAAIVYSLSKHNKYVDVAKDSIADYRAEISSTKVMMEELLGRLKGLTVGTEEYNKVKNLLLENYGDYLSDIDKEKIEVGELAGLYDDLAKKIEDSTKARYFDTASKKLEDTHIKRQGDIIKKAQKIVGEEEGSGELLAYIYGSLNKDELSQEAKKRYNEIIKAANPKGAIGDFRDGLFGSGIENNPIERLRGLMQKEGEALKAGAKMITDTFEALIFNDGPKADVGEIPEWINKVKSVTDKLDKTTLTATGLERKDGEDYYEYLKRIGEQWQEIREEKDKALKVDKPVYEGYLEAIKQMDEALEGNILKDVRYNRSPWNGSDDQNESKLTKEQKETIANAKDEINILNKLMDAYNKLADAKYGLSDEQIKEKMLGLFSADLAERIKAGNFEDSILAQIAIIKAIVPAEADKLAASLGMDGLSLALKQMNEQLKGSKDAAKTLEKYADAVRKWQENARDYEGEGANFTMSKILEDAAAAKLKVDNQLAEDKKLATEAYKGNNEELAKQVKLLEDYAAAAKKAINIETQNKISGYASKLFSESTADLGLKNYKNKSIFSLLSKYQALEGRSFDDILNDDIKKAAAAQGISLDSLKDAYNQYISNEQESIAGRVAQKLKAVANSVLDLGEAIGEYGDASGSSLMSSVSSAISGIGELAQAAAQGFASGGPWGLALGALVAFGKALIEDAAYMAQLEKAIDAARLEKWRADMEEILGSSSGFFGENGMQKISSGAEVAAKALAKLRGVTGGVGADTKIKTVDRGFIAEGWSGDKIEALGDVAAKLGYDLYDAYGNLNADALQAILDTYEKLDASDRAWMEEAVAYAEEYEEALKSVEEVAQEIFGELASSAADAIVDSWAEAGDAALDYADILDDVARRYAKMLVQSALLDSVFNEDFKKELISYVQNNDVAGAMELVQGGMDKIVENMPFIQEMLEPLVPYLNGSAEDTESALANGIKSITEDTANLLAAYVNAMRADVAAGNAQRGEILALLREYTGAGSAPSYTEYLTKIEAHTANMAANTNSILSELRSIITPESGAPAVRVQTA